MMLIMRMISNIMLDFLFTISMVICNRENNRSSGRNIFARVIKFGHQRYEMLGKNMERNSRAVIAA